MLLGKAALLLEAWERVSACAGVFSVSVSARCQTMGRPQRRSPRQSHSREGLNVGSGGGGGEQEQRPREEHVHVPQWRHRLQAVITPWAGVRQARVATDTLSSMWV